ncbi:MAG TPA: hypothetical protein VIY48_09635 [Candidatus Paceibacterota bacterium]
MRQRFKADNFVDEHGHPTGGYVKGTGIDIQWQNGPLNRGAERIEPNGAFVEDVIAAALQRIEHYQGSKFACVENANAISALQSALDALNARTFRREAAGTEGTHEGN